MKISVEHAPLEENEVILRCSNLDQEMLWVLSILRSGLQKLCAWDERREVTLLSPSEVVYCESVDDHTFLYTSATMRPCCGSGWDCERKECYLCSEKNLSTITAGASP